MSVSSARSIELSAREQRSEEAISGDTSRHSLREILSSENLSAAEKVRSLLQVGTERLGVENGHLAEIDPAGGTHTIVASSGPHPSIEVGGSTDLSKTYCRTVVAEGGSFAVSDAEAEGWSDDPAYKTWDLACYHGTMGWRGRRSLSPLAS